MNETYTINASPVHETQDALLVETDLHDEDQWVPKSVIHDNTEVWKKGQERGELVVMRWWAKKEGWCDD